MLRLTTLSAFSFSLMLLGACSSSTERQSEALIDQRGGELELRLSGGGTASLAVPANTVSTSTRFSIEQISVSGLQSQQVAIGTPVHLEPEGIAFTTPITLKISANVRPTALLTRSAAGQPWTKVDGATWNATTQQIQAQLQHFSDYLPIVENANGQCDDGIDNDDNGIVDDECNDAQDGGVAPDASGICDDGIDNDDNGIVDDECNDAG